MSIKLNDSIRVQGGKPVEDKRLNNGVVYTSVTQANALIAKTDRYPTLEVAIKIGGATFIYWYKDGVENSDLVLKQEGGGGEGTLPSIMIFKDTVPTYNDLQAVTGQEQGWVYGVVSQGKLYVWIEDYGGIAGNNIWKDMGVTVDFSNYYTREEVDDLLEDYVVSDFLNTYFYTKEQSNNRYISKQGINLRDTGNIPEMKTGDISGIYRGDGASNAVYDYSPFIQMTTADTFAQLHFNYLNGEMAYRAGNADIGYSPIRISWDTGNLVNPATQTWVNTQLATKQDKSMFSALVDKMVHYYDLATQKMLSTGVEFISAGIMKFKSIILTTNTGTALANELGTDGTNVVFGASKKKLAFKDEIFEHNVRGKVIESTGVTGTYNCDLNAATRWILILTGNTTIAFTNMILADETITISMNITGNFTLTFPSWLKESPFSESYDGTKINRIVIEIGKGGASPIGWYNRIRFDS